MKSQTKKYKTIRYFLLGVIFAFTNVAFTQITNFEQIVPLENQKPKTFEDYLVQLAWYNNPDNRILEINKNIAEKNVKIVKYDWTKDLNVAFNINEVSLENVITPRKDNIILFPLYSLTASISLGTFIQNPKKREVAEFKVIQTGHKINQRKLQIRAEVLRRYQKHLLSIKILKARTQAEEDARTNYQMSNDLFSKNRIPMNQFSEASKLFFKAKEDRLAAETEVKITIIELEELIGIKWDVALRYKGFIN